MTPYIEKPCLVVGYVESTEIGRAVEVEGHWRLVIRGQKVRCRTPREARQLLAIHGAAFCTVGYRMLGEQ
jgi:hypothetical protein